MHKADLQAYWSIYRGQFQTWVNVYDEDNGIVGASPSYYTDYPKEWLESRTWVPIENGLGRKGRWYPAKEQLVWLDETSDTGD